MRGRNGLVLVGALVLLTGYTVTYWGYVQLNGGGLSFLDLLLPSRYGKSSAWQVAGAKGSGSGSDTPQYPPGAEATSPSGSTGVAPGSPPVTSKPTGPGAPGSAGGGNPPPPAYGGPPPAYGQ